MAAPMELDVKTNDEQISRGGLELPWVGALYVKEILLLFWRAKARAAADFSAVREVSSSIHP